MSTRFCSQCGFKIEGSSRYCDQCGSRITSSIFYPWFPVLLIAVITIGAAAWFLFKPQAKDDASSAKVEESPAIRQTTSARVTTEGLKKGSESIPEIDNALAEKGSEYECNMAAVNRDRSKWEKLLNKYPQTRYTPDLMNKVAMLYFYPTQCGISKDEATYSVSKLRKLYSEVQRHYPDSAAEQSVKSFLDLAVQNLNLMQLRNSESQQNQQKRTMADMRAIGTAVEAYAVDNNVYPTVSSSEFGSFRTEDIAPSVEPKYIRTLPRRDAWGNSFLYLTSKRGQLYWIVSYGSDGRPDSGLYDDTGFPTNSGVGATHNFTDDIIFSQGSFLRFPEGSQQ